MKELTEDERNFLKEAEKGHFIYGREDDGRPWAIGAHKTGNLFSMEVVEEMRMDESLYYLPEK